MLLSRNFDSSELCVSAQFPDLVAKIEPNDEQIHRAVLLAQSCAQPLRDEFGPLHVLSWLRSKELNEAVGGSEDSDHLYGAAVDLRSRRVTALELFSYGVGACLPYRQIIYYPGENFVHISINFPGRPFGHEAFTHIGGRYVRLRPAQVAMLAYKHWMAGAKEVAGEDWT